MRRTTRRNRSRATSKKHCEIALSPPRVRSRWRARRPRTRSPTRTRCCASRSDRRDRLRSAGGAGPLLEPRQPRDLRSAVPYDYLARPYKLVPNTAAALPEISAGRPAPGRSASSRASTSPTTRRSRARSASSPRTTTSTRWKRLLDPKVRSPNCGHLRRQARRRRRGDREGEGDRQVRLRRADRGPAGARPLHAAAQARRARLRAAAEPDARRRSAPSRAK